MNPVKISLPTLALVLAISGGASAEDAAADQAKAAFDEATELFADGDYVAAADMFRRAHELKPAWRLLYNIGQSEAAAKRHGLALEAFEKYLSQGGDDIEESRREEVTEEIERMRTIVGTLEVAAPDGSTVLVDGLERGQTPLTGRLRVSAGVDHLVEIRRGGEVLISRRFTVGGKENLVIDASPDGDGVTAAADDEPESDAESPAVDEPGESSGLRTGGVVALVVGGALLAVGGITGGAALKKNDEVVSACNDEDGCDPAKWQDVKDKRDALATTSTVMFGVGAAAVAAGVIMLLVRSGDESDASADVSLAPVAGPGFTGMTVSGRF